VDELALRASASLRAAANVLRKMFEAASGSDRDHYLKQMIELEKMADVMDSVTRPN
jgi:hypothetical protein